MSKPITSEVVVAHSQCPRKAYLMLYTDDQGTPHEYEHILEQRKIANQDAYLHTFRQEHPNTQLYNSDKLKCGSDFLINATLLIGTFEATCGILTRVETPSSLGEYSYEPTIFFGTHRIDKYQKLALSFVGYVLGQIQGTSPVTGRIVGMGPKSHRVKLENSGKTLNPLLDDLQELIQTRSPEFPPIILSKHCPYCQFEHLCRVRAEEEDNLSLLDRVTPKVIRRYEKKGIFTVKQLSYLYKPRRRKKRAKNRPPSVHKPELQALAIRTGKIYLQDLSELTRKPIELFLDIEGIPDQQYDYLIGLLVGEIDTCTYLSFWADTSEDESTMWQQFVEKANRYPDAPIYHYGNYEARSIARLARRYEVDAESFKSRLVNVNAYVYGRVYFPVYSNRLKDIGAFIGATWTSPNASGLQSLVWRYRWDETYDARYKDSLVAYNREDCRALKLLTDEITKIQHSAEILSEVDFTDRPKRSTTQIGKEVHSQFEAILKFANANYDKKKIQFRQVEKIQHPKQAKNGPKKGYQGQKKTRPKAAKLVEIQPDQSCPRCGYEPLSPTRYKSKRLIIDLVLMKRGIKKTVTEYVGTQGYCSKCGRNYAPSKIREYGPNTLYGHGLKAWVIFQRIAMRLPYEGIAEGMREQFNEDMPSASVGPIIRDFGQYYSDTEKRIIERLLGSHFIHVDETPVSIRGVTQYVWVFTDGNYVAFKLRKTREASVVHQFLGDYDGILVSDFYAGYDSVRCEQQKCWVHLIRNINEDLWRAPFDAEFEKFASEVRSLIVPIMEAVQKYGLKKRNLNKFRKQVVNFYNTAISDVSYKSEFAIKYQKRFLKYRDSLFTFLEQDGVPWNNNAAERAIRHIAKQRAISGSFHEAIMHHYLVLLSIRQTCRFHKKSFFRFLFSGQTDLDTFEVRKRRPYT